MHCYLCHQCSSTDSPARIKFSRKRNKQTNISSTALRLALCQMQTMTMWQLPRTWQNRRRLRIGTLIQSQDNKHPIEWANILVFRMHCIRHEPTPHVSVAAMLNCTQLECRTFGETRHDRPYTVPPIVRVHSSTFCRSHSIWAIDCRMETMWSSRMRWYCQRWSMHECLHLASMQCRHRSNIRLCTQWRSYKPWRR